MEGFMDEISMSQAMEKLTGGTRTDEQIAKDGAKLVISQISKLRRQLDQAERACQQVMLTGKPRKDDAAIWNRVAKACDKLLDGMFG
jgi:uncharacterized protein involved in exopolysaccharide biosynthesis